MVCVRSVVLLVYSIYLSAYYCFKHSGDKERDRKWKLPEYFNVSTKRTKVPLVCFLFTQIMPNNPK